MTALYEHRIRVAFGDGPFEASPTWTDITDYVRLGDGFSASRGQGDQDDAIQSGTFSFTVNNDDGRFSPGRATLLGGGGNPYHPLKIRCPVQWQVRYPRTSGTWQTMWQGSVNDWGSNIANGVRGQSRVTCSDVWARLGRELPAMYEAEVLQDAPYAFWTLGEPEGATSAVSRTNATEVPPLVAEVDAGGAALDFGAGSVSADSLPTCAITVGTPGARARLFGTGFQAHPIAALECVFTIADPSKSVVVFRIGDLVQIYTTAGVLGARCGTWDLSTGVQVADGQQHHVIMLLSVAGGGNGRVLLDGATVATAGSFSLLDAFDTNTEAWTGTVADHFEGQLSHIAVYDTPLTVARAQQHHAALGNSESAHSRWLRLARVAGVPATTSGASAATLGPQPLKGEPAPSAMQTVAEAEAGRAFVSAGGELILTARGASYHATAAFTVPASAVGEDVEWTYDDQFLVNEATASRYAGSEQRAVDAASLAEYGPGYVRSVSTYHADDEQTLQWCNWQVGSYAQPQVRCGQVSIDLVTKAASVDVADVIGAEIGQRFTVTGLPVGAPADTADLFIEGVSDQVSTTAWVRTFNTSGLGLTASVWRLGTDALDSTTLLAL